MIKNRFSKKILLAGSALFVVGSAYFVFSSGDKSVARKSDGQGMQSVRQFVSVPTTQGTQSLGDSQMPISPGEKTTVVVYDEVSSRPKYKFQAEGWKPINDTDYHVEDLLITIYTARGETTYISADEADVTLAQKAKNRIDAQRGILRGKVRVVIDRTTSEWREQNPDLADMKLHPDDLITIDLETARFDMDRAELISEGAVVVDSREARIEDVSNLTVHWNQVDNRIEVLQFAEGGKMTIRRGANLVEFGLPGGSRKSKKEKKVEASLAQREASAGLDVPSNADTGERRIPLARANEPMKIDSVSTEQAASEIRLEGARFMANKPQSIGEAGEQRTGVESELLPSDLRSPETLAADLESVRRETQSALASDANTKPPPPEAKDEKAAPSVTANQPKSRKKEKRVHTYRAVFTNDVVVQQLRAAKPVGRLEADKLEVHFDFGGPQRKIATRGEEEIPDGRPMVAANQPMTANPSSPVKIDDDPKQRPAGADRGQLESARADLDDADDTETILLTWHGPLELRPLFVPPVEQTGKRFDVIAIGKPVNITSEQGSARCLQLVYRGERKQVWLQGEEKFPVEMSVDENRRLAGVEVFFDQRRGLGHVDGAGYMIDRKGDLSRSNVRAGEVNARGIATLAQAQPTDMMKSLKPDDPVEIRWSRGVDLEIGARPVQRVSETTGRLEQGDKDYLRRAWFHGDAVLKRGEETLEADEVAATFGVPSAEEDAADFIEHLDMKGNVRLEREGELITAQKLDVKLFLGSNKQQVPRSIDAEGDVIAIQSGREIRAQVMHVEMNQFPGEMRLAADGKTQIPGDPRVGIETLDATGDVFLQDRDSNTKIREAESLKARFRNGGELVMAKIVSPSPEIFARARFRTMALHGHRIEMDMDRQSVDVPGPGRAWMLSNANFAGRKSSKPMVIRTTWTDQMQLRWAKNYGVFVGNVRSKSEDFVINADKLTIRFVRTPKSDEPQPKQPSDDWMAKFTDVFTKSDRDDFVVEQNVRLNMKEKKPAYVIAEGHAEALASSYAKTGGPDRGRLLNRTRISGDQIVADLLSEQMSVPGAGNMLIEDYKFADAPSRAAARRTARVNAPLMSSARSDGPSQTLIEWENSMDFFLDRSLVAFDKDVRMLHLSGRQMVLKDDLADAFKLDDKVLHKISEGRRAELSCGNLLLEFEAKRAAGTEGESTANTAMLENIDLERLIARDAAHMQDGTKSLMGEYLQYLAHSNEVRLEGGEGLDARVIDQAENGRFNMWRGPLLIWNRATNAIQAPRSTITTSGR
ncbi:MAG TPA: hypothetical protein VNT79_16455 [Phycisphaerae bacterium]|nr:hypothetical protein [Phycisphaerae bacterium]